jgi:hypothetical protein
MRQLIPHDRASFGSGDGERKTLLTRQIAFELLPASVLFVQLLVVALLHGWCPHRNGSAQ